MAHRQSFAPASNTADPALANHSTIFPEVLMKNLNVMLDLFQHKQDEVKSHEDLFQSFLGLLNTCNIYTLELAMLMSLLPTISRPILNIVCQYYDDTELMNDFAKKFDEPHRAAVMTTTLSIKQTLQAIAAPKINDHQFRNGLPELIVPWEKFNEQVMLGFPGCDDLLRQCIHVYPDTTILSFEYIKNHREAFPAAGILVARLTDICYMPTVIILNDDTLQVMMSSIPPRENDYAALYKKAGFCLGKKSEMVLFHCTTPENQTITLEVAGMDTRIHRLQKSAPNRRYMLSDEFRKNGKKHQFVMFDPSQPSQSTTDDCIVLYATSGIKLESCSFQMAVFPLDDYEYEIKSFQNLVSQRAHQFSIAGIEDRFQYAELSYTQDQLTEFKSPTGFCMVPCTFGSDCINLLNWKLPVPVDLPGIQSKMPEPAIKMAQEGLLQKIKLHRPTPGENKGSSHPSKLDANFSYPNLRVLERQEFLNGVQREADIQNQSLVLKIFSMTARGMFEGVALQLKTPRARQLRKTVPIE